MMDKDILNQEFGIDDHLGFRNLNDETVVVDIANNHCNASMVMQGAHLTAWQPKHCHEPVIWLSAGARFARGKSIRGGIPICWPWFGPHESQTDFPAHGYARTVDWELISTKQVNNSGTELQLRLLENEHSRALWPYRSECNLRIVAGDTLRLELTTQNRDERVFILGEALHTYFVVGDIENIRVSGLDQVEYYDKVDDKIERQQGVIRFSGETDRVYMNTRSSCFIEDEQLGRCIIIDKSTSDSTVIWNPWRDRAAEMGDLGEDGWRRMLCVETANALDNRLILEPGQTHTVSVEYRVENI